MNDQSHAAMFSLDEALLLRLDFGVDMNSLLCTHWAKAQPTIAKRVKIVFIVDLLDQWVLVGFV